MAAVGLLIILAGVAVYAAFSGRAPELSEREQRIWQSAIDADPSAVGRGLLRLARPMASSRLVSDAAGSPTYRALAQKVMGAGGVFAGSIEVFLAVQAFSVFVAIGVIVAVMFAQPEPLVYLLGVLAAVGVALYPYNVVAKKARERADAVDSGLPEFAELLQMPLRSGLGVKGALAFTAGRLEGPVADETRRMLQVINSRSLPEAEAFELAGNRVGTPEAQAFFNSCMQASLQGSSLIEPLEKQAEALRFSAYQKARKKLKRLPVNLVLIMAVHFIPTLVVIVMIPGAVALGNI